MAGLAETLAATEVSFMGSGAARLNAAPRSYGNWTRRVQRLAVGLAMAWVAVLPAPAAPAAPDRPIRIVVLGDSLVAGHGLPANQAFPAQLEKALQSQGANVAITNAGVSGDTATGGLARLDWSVPDGTDAVIVTLGANDMLRGTPPDVTRRALSEIVQRLKARNIEVLLTGMLAARNLGADYGRAFDAIYPNLAATEQVILYPFFLEGIAIDSKLNQRDGLHPTADGVTAIVSRILPKVEELLARVRARRGS
jgi:acyl-CoA thioesterase-1